MAFASIRVRSFLASWNAAAFTGSAALGAYFSMSARRLWIRGMSSAVGFR